MAIYHYRCEDCGVVTCVWAKMSDPAPTHCPECNSTKLTKLMERTSFTLKGGGWFAQGYAGHDNCPSSGCCSGCAHNH